MICLIHHDDGDREEDREEIMSVAESEKLDFSDASEKIKRAIVHYVEQRGKLFGVGDKLYIMEVE